MVAGTSDDSVEDAEDQEEDELGDDVEMTETIEYLNSLRPSMGGRDQTDARMRGRSGDTHGRAESST